MSRYPATPKVYEEEIVITVRPFDGWRSKWRAEATVPRPYKKDWGGYDDNVVRFAKTAEEAVERLKDKLCKITEREERKHATHQEWEAGIKETTFSRDQGLLSREASAQTF